MAVVVRLIGYLITILFFGYSFLRYRHLWKRGRVPVWIYYGLQIIFCGALVVCQWWGRLFPDETLRTVLSLISVFYYCAMFYMPVLCFFRGMIREAGRRRKNPVF